MVYKIIVEFDVPFSGQKMQIFNSQFLPFIGSKIYFDGYIYLVKEVIFKPRTVHMEEQEYLDVLVKAEYSCE